ncbi:MAG: NUDIX hydrolase [Erysipelotrichaceae bacterium]|nr:NUDIX hydrolase [Erysipelotrichaceae bacterium]
MSIREDIRNYKPFNIQEQKDKRIILEYLDRYDDAFYRSNELAHMTASAWVVNKDKTRVLMAYHKIYNSWAWLGGHCDGDEDCLAVALREVREEAGVKSVVPVSEDIFSLEILSVDSHIKRGEYVPTHLHLNVTYLLEADENDELFIKEDENSGVAWFEKDEAIERSNEKWFKENIYKKLNQKLKELYEDN